MFEILPSRLKISGSKEFYPTAKENGKYLHSSYNPLREAEQAAKTLHGANTDPEPGSNTGNKKEIFGAAFFACGLGYTVIEYARLFPRDTIILVESDTAHFFAALSALDWSPFFSAQNIVLAINTEPSQVIALIEKCGGFSHISIYENAAQSAHAESYFSALNALVARNRQKSKINSATLEKFSSLWLRNSCRNLHFLSEKDGVSIYSGNLSPGIPALILAAGPTLAKVLPCLKELKKRALLIAVDTSLRACLKQGVEPDFIVLADPQYYAYRHIAGLSSPHSVLITESAAYPAVFRFNCRKIVMCSSMFPLGRFVESKIGAKGALSAGGSVSTTAWDFARCAGAKDIIFAGLDLGYPDLQTHIRGSTFEEKIHTLSNRLNPAEKMGASALFSAGTQKAQDYSGNEILTDSRMKMFAWWFESKQAEFNASGIKSYSLSQKSLKIPGFNVISLEQILNLPDVSSLKNDFFNKSEGVAASRPGLSGFRPSASLPPATANAAPTPPNASTAEKFSIALKTIQNGLQELFSLAEEAEAVCINAVSNRANKNLSEFSSKLSQIDLKISNSKFKDIASLVFPTEAQLEKIFASGNFSRDGLTASFQRSKIIYSLVKKSVQEYQKNLFQR